MRGFLTFMACLFLGHLSFGQLSVSPSKSGKSNYIFVDGGSLFVGNGIHLALNTSKETEASIYLRKEAQLLQGPLQNTMNSGDGLVSVFQEGTSNAYDYNYWSSPVVSPQNGLFGISLLFRPETLTKSQVAQNTTALNGTSVPLTISSRWIYIYTGSGYSSWNFIGAATAIPAGYGFSMKGTEGADMTAVDGKPNNPGAAQRYDFRGRPNSGKLEIPVAAEEMVLVGNPYPSAFDLSLFLLENSGSGEVKSSCYENIQRENVITGIAYFWDSKEEGNSHYLDEYEGGYGAFSPVDPCTTGVYEKPIFKNYGTTDNSSGIIGNNVERRFTPIGQGFMVQGADGGMIKFHNGQRGFKKEGDNSQFQTAERKDSPGSAKRNPEILPKLRLQVRINDSYTRSLSLVFWPNATKGVDRGMDAAAFDEAPADVGWLHDDRNFIIDVRPYEILDEIPLFLKVDEQLTHFSFVVEALENLNLDKVLILDAQTGSYSNILEDVFNLDLAPGDYNGRFKIVFAEKLNEAILPAEISIAEEDQDFSIFQNNYMKELEIISDSYAPVKSVGIFDLKGKKLLFRSNFSNKRSLSLSTAHWAEGIYIVKVTDTQNKLTTKKIAVFNSK